MGSSSCAFIDFIFIISRSKQLAPASLAGAFIIHGAFLGEFALEFVFDFIQRDFPLFNLVENQLDQIREERMDIFASESRRFNRFQAQLFPEALAFFN